MRETEYLQENEKVLKLLKRIEKFKGFSEDDIRSFLSIAKLREYDPGEDIINRGDKDSWVYFLISGEVKVTRENKTLGVLNRSGDLFGEMGVIDGSPRSASVWSVSKAMVLAIDCSSLTAGKPDTNELAFRYTLYRLFSEVLADRLRITTEEASKLKKDVMRLEKEVADLKKAGGETLWV